MAHLRLSDVVVEYPIYNAGALSFRHRLLAIGTGGRLEKATGRIVTVTALDGINLDLRDGDRVGLIGHNGAGKTTLLRTMAGIFSPTRGTIARSGRISTVFGLNAGLDPELTGYENIIRGVMLYGATYKEALAAVPDIEAFTDLGDFLTVPVRTYSSGMLTRLLFAIATAIPPEILLVDEVFGAGDADFQERARARMGEFTKQASIFVLASHSPELVRLHCHKVLRLEHGKVVEDR